MLNKTHSLKHLVYLVGLRIYYKMIHGPYNINVSGTLYDRSAYMSRVKRNAPGDLNPPE